MKHRVVWFKELVAGIPVGAGELAEDTLNAWDLAEVLRLEFGINMEAYVPVVDSLDELDPADLCSPERALEIVSAERLDAIRDLTVKIKDRYGMPREVKGSEVASWLESYRELWRQGYSVVRTASE